MGDFNIGDRVRLRTQVWDDALVWRLPAGTRGEVTDVRPHWIAVRFTNASSNCNCSFECEHRTGNPVVDVRPEQLEPSY